MEADTEGRGDLKKNWEAILCEGWKTEESEAIEAQNSTGCQNSVIKTNNILMQYFLKNQN